MDLYDFLHVSELIDGLEKTFPGFLLVFFPGEKEGNTYRFLDARTGWNYLAVQYFREMTQQEAPQSENQRNLPQRPTGLANRQRGRLQQQYRRPRNTEV